VSRGEGELLTVPKPRAVGLLSACLTVKPVGEPDALIGHVRFDERGWETERCRMAQATAPILDSTIASFRCAAKLVGYWTNNGQKSARTLTGSAAIDPSATLAVHCGNGFDAGFSPYQSTRLSR
jgi:hypothetical protein